MDCIALLIGSRKSFSLCIRYKMSPLMMISTPKTMTERSAKIKITTCQPTILKAKTGMEADAYFESMVLIVK
jgi:hypothetical protein